MEPSNRSLPTFHQAVRTPRPWPRPLGWVRDALARLMSRTRACPPHEPCPIPSDERVWGQETYLDVRVLDTMLRRTRGVGRIEHEDGFGIGTGFLVAPDLLLTCRHVLEHENPSQLRVCLYAYERGPARRVAIGVITWMGAQLDAALVELSEPMDADAVLPLRHRDPDRPSERAYIIGYPNASSTPQISLHDSRVLGADANHLQYRTPTDPGSSGSPIFDDDLNVVGIHARSQGQDSRAAQGINEGLRIEPVWKQIAPFVLRGRPPMSATPSADVDGTPDQHAPRCEMMPRQVGRPALLEPNECWRREINASTAAIAATRSRKVGRPGGRVAQRSKRRQYRSPS